MGQKSFGQCTVVAHAHAKTDSTSKLRLTDLPKTACTVWSDAAGRCRTLELPRPEKASCLYQTPAPKSKTAVIKRPYSRWLPPTHCSSMFPSPNAVTGYSTLLIGDGSSGTATPLATSFRLSKPPSSSAATTMAPQVGDNKRIHPLK